MKTLKFAFFTGILSLASAAFAHDLKPIKAFSNKNMQAAYTAAKSIAKDMGNFGALEAYEIRKIDPKRAKSESLNDVYIRVLKAQLHRDYPITGDDGGYSVSAERTLKGVRAALGDDIVGNSGADAFLTEVGNCIDNGLMVLVGNGSGNNTMAAYVAVVDVKKQEMFYLLSSNFGSDD